MSLFSTEPDYNSFNEIDLLSKRFIQAINNKNTNDIQLINAEMHIIHGRCLFKYHMIMHELESQLRSNITNTELKNLSTYSCLLNYACKKICEPEEIIRNSNDYSLRESLNSYNMSMNSDATQYVQDLCRSPEALEIMKLSKEPSVENIFRMKELHGKFLLNEYNIKKHIDATNLNDLRIISNNYCMGNWLGMLIVKSEKDLLPGEHSHSYSQSQSIFGVESIPSYQIQNQNQSRATLANSYANTNRSQNEISLEIPPTETTSKKWFGFGGHGSYGSYGPDTDMPNSITNLQTDELDDMIENHSNLNLDVTKPTIINFYASWCPASREFLPKWLKLKEKYSNRVQMVEYDCSKDNVKKLCSEFSVKAYPTVAVIDSKHKVSLYEGAISESKCEDIVRKI